MREDFSTKLRSSFGATYWKIRDAGMSRRALKSEQDCSFWSSEKLRKVFSKNYDSVKSSLQKWITYHPHVIKSPIVNDYITVKFDDGNLGVKTEIRQKVLLHVSVREIHTDMQKIC